MTSHLSEAVAEKIGHAESLYHRLVLVAGADGSADAAALKAVAEYIDATRINVSLELPRRPLDLTERQRRIRVPRLLGGIVAEAAADIVLLDNVELLKAVVTAEDLKAVLLAGASPTSPPEMKARFEEYLDSLAKGEDPAKVRVVLE